VQWGVNKNALALHNRISEFNGVERLSKARLFVTNFRPFEFKNIGYKKVRADIAPTHQVGFWCLGLLIYGMDKS